MARRVVGVREVIDRIAVVPSHRRSDADITESVRTVLAGNLSREEMAAVKISVHDGVVTLSGTLPQLSETDRRTAGRLGNGSSQCPKRYRSQTERRNSEPTSTYSRT